MSYHSTAERSWMSPDHRLFETSFWVAKAWWYLCIAASLQCSRSHSPWGRGGHWSPEGPFLPLCLECVWLHSQARVPHWASLLGEVCRGCWEISRSLSQWHRGHYRKRMTSEGVPAWTGRLTLALSETVQVCVLTVQVYSLRNTSLRSPLL